MRQSMTACLLLALGGCASTPPTDRLQVSGRIDPALQREGQCHVLLEGREARPVEGRFSIDYVTEPDDREHPVRVECRSADGRLLASQQSSARAGERLDLGLVAASCPEEAEASAQAAVVAAIERDMHQRSGPRIALVEVYGVLLDGDWALAEVAFDRLGPTLFALQREEGAYRVRSHYSGSVPGRPLTAMAQQRLADGTPGLPPRLLGCYPSPG